MSRLAIWLYITNTVCFVGVAMGLVFLVKQYADFSRCTSQWQEQFATAYQARVDTTAPVSDAMDQIVKGVADQNSKAFRAGVRNYVEVRARQDIARQDNPLPPLPSVKCGG